MTDEPISYEDRGEYLRAVADPQYAQSARYRDQVAAKLQASMTSGTITPMGRRADYGSTIHTRNVFHEPQAIYGSHNPLPGADPLMAEAAKVGIAGSLFEGPEQIAAAMGAPQFDLDPTYQEAVHAKIGRSIRAGSIDTNFNALDPSKGSAR